jgi:hypothetical protein
MARRNERHHIVIVPQCSSGPSSFRHLFDGRPS